MNFKKTFLGLTQYTIPHGYEETITFLLPKGLEKDGIGNYRITIGESETLFTCHLDTVSTRMKVNHIIQGDIIRTDGTTILGGDNKAGVCILMYLIEQKVPGTYYFFVGEETGCIGSRWALKNDPEYFKKFKRAIAFDRKKKGSIITKQRSNICTSDDFAKALSNEFTRLGLEYKPDDTGVYTDSAVFMGVIPECTNISSGVYGEHTKEETIDIAYLEKVAKISAQIEWDKLPTKREAVMEIKNDKRTTTTTYGNHNHYWNYNQQHQQHTCHTSDYKKNNIGFEQGGATSVVKFNSDNIHHYFNLTKMNSSEEDCFADVKGNIWKFVLRPDVISIALQLSYNRYDVKYMESNFTKIPKTFDELWKQISDKVSFTPKKLKDATKHTTKHTTTSKEYKKKITLIVDDTVTSAQVRSIVNMDDRILGLEILSHGNTKTQGKKFYDINLILNGNISPSIQTFTVESITERFKKFLGAIITPANDTKPYSSSVYKKNEPDSIQSSIKFNKQEKKMPTQEDVSKFFALTYIPSEENRYRYSDTLGNIYDIEVSDDKYLTIYMIIDHIKWDYLYYGQKNTWEEYWEELKHMTKIRFVPRLRTGVFNDPKNAVNIPDEDDEEEEEDSRLDISGIL